MFGNRGSNTKRKLESKMFEYKTEVFKMSTRVSSAGVKNSKKTEELDSLNQLLNSYASNGWELVSQSMAMDDSLMRYSVLLTFKRVKA